MGEFPILLCLIVVAHDDGLFACISSLQNDNDSALLDTIGMRLETIEAKKPTRSHYLVERMAS